MVIKLGIKCVHTLPQTRSVIYTLLKAVTFYSQRTKIGNWTFNSANSQMRISHNTQVS